MQDKWNTKKLHLQGHSFWVITISYTSNEQFMRFISKCDDLNIAITCIILKINKQKMPMFIWETIRSSLFDICQNQVQNGSLVCTVSIYSKTKQWKFSFKQYLTLNSVLTAYTFPSVKWLTFRLGDISSDTWRTSNASCECWPRCKTFARLTRATSWWCLKHTHFY